MTMMINKMTWKQPSLKADTYILEEDTQTSWKLAQKHVKEYVTQNGKGDEGWRKCIKTPNGTKCKILDEENENSYLTWLEERYNTFEML